MSLSKRREDLKAKWREVKSGSYSRNEFDSELKKYNDMLLASYMVVFVILYGIYITINVLIHQWSATTIGAIVIGALAGFTATLILYQSKRLEVAEDSKQYVGEVSAEEKAKLEKALLASSDMTIDEIRRLSK